VPILLDTNVVSELMKAQSDPNVADALRAAGRDGVFVPSIVATEIAYGIEIMPAGAKRDRLARAAKLLFAEKFAGRTIPLDDGIAWEAGRVRAERKALGCEDDLADDIIAATARVRGLTLATRNAKDFVGLGLRLLDPWRG
jgi:toxin FitB